MTLRISRSPIWVEVRSSARAMVSTSSAEVVAGRVSLNRTLPLNETG